MVFYPRFIFFLLFLLSANIKLLAQPEKITHTVYLIGDAGKDTSTGKALQLLQQQLIIHSNSTVIFLGDNVYPRGFILNDNNSRKRLLSQLKILKEYRGNVFFIPGNHDWKAGRYKGLKTIKDEAEFVKTYLKENTGVKNKHALTFLPENGFPGPESQKLAEKLRLIIIDTQWWLHFYPVGKNGTRKHTKEEFFIKLDSLLQLAKLNNEQVIIAGHHPLYSNGSHSKSRQPWRFIINYTPFQVFGMMGMNKFLVQDIPEIRYARMRKKLLEVIDKHNNIIYAAGHEHNLQYFKENNNRYIVSGAGSKKSEIKQDKYKCLFIDGKKTGFFKIDYFEDGKIQVEVFRTEENSEIIETF